MYVEQILLRKIHIDLVRSFETHLGTTKTRRSIVVSAMGDGVTGYGECVAGLSPLSFSYESIETAWYILNDVLCPGIAGKNLNWPQDFHRFISKIRGHQMAIASLEMALWHLYAKLEAKPLSVLLGGSRGRIKVGISLGLQRSVPALIELIQSEGLNKGYHRIKLKIKQGWDINMLREVRDAFPDACLTVDANGGYTLQDAKHLAKLDEFALLYIEQPLQYSDLVDHARLQAQMKTPISLDESIRDPHDAYQALELHSCGNINIKPGRVGGLTNSIAIHDLCQQRGIPVWCGGMAETGIGKAHNVALSSLSNFSLPNDIAESCRHYAADIVDPPWQLNEDGTLTVPEGPGIGVDINEDALNSLTMERKTFRAKHRL